VLVVELATTRVLADLSRGRAAEQPADRAIDLARSTGDPAMEATATNAAALVAYREGRNSPAASHAEAADRLAEIAALPLLQAGAANLRGLVQLRTGDQESAISSFDRALRILATRGDRHRLAAVHANLADALHSAGRDDDARPHQLESARLFSEVTGPPLEGRPELWHLTAW
jgi:tetratricopeptide (TPR) repeat protein